MTQNMNPIAREKLTKLVPVLNAAASKLESLSKTELPKEELVALGQLNDRVAVYLQEIVMMLADDSPLQIDAVVEFIEVVEFCANQIEQIG